MRRVIYVVLDGVGVGALPDAHEYGDAGADTLGNASRIIPLHVPTLEALGLGNIAPITGVPPVADPRALVGRLAPRSVGKDTTVGHWEQMGLITDRAFPTFPEGFPVSLVREFEKSIGRAVLGNRPASGTAIIAELGQQHVATGEPIIYTSADSVFQIAAHTDVVPLEQLYEWCGIARGLLAGPLGVARVIARPFRGEAGAFERTSDRKDFSLAPPDSTYLDELVAAGRPVVALGKIAQVFAGKGVTESIKVGRNDENLLVLTELVQGRDESGAHDGALLITNLVDFDTLWGHRNDVEGFVQALQETDRAVGRLLDTMGSEDLLIITADHGVDPTTVSTDHSREYVPLLVYPRPADTPQSVYEGDFADAGATAYHFLTGNEPSLSGRSVLEASPARGWRRYTPVQRGVGRSAAAIPGRVGSREAREAAARLEEVAGPAPEVAVVLGSGLGLSEPRDEAVAIPYGDIPHWRTGSVGGHSHAMVMTRIGGKSCAVLSGRIHEYEGFDLSEVQLPVRSLALWGVGSLILTSAAGAVDPGLVAGDLVLCERVLDYHYRDDGGMPTAIAATSAEMADAIMGPGGLERTVPMGVHVSVPGPQYETPAELDLLRATGVATVSMSPAAELRAALEEGIRVATVAVVTNTGDTSHADVLAAAAQSHKSLRDFVEVLVESLT